MLTLLANAGRAGLTLEDWNDKSRAEGIGTRRRADLHDCREALKAKKLVYEHAGQWHLSKRT